MGLLSLQSQKEGAGDTLHNLKAATSMRSKFDIRPCQKIERKQESKEGRKKGRMERRKEGMKGGREKRKDRRAVKVKSQVSTFVQPYVT